MKAAPTWFFLAAILAGHAAAQRPDGFLAELAKARTDYEQTVVQAVTAAIHLLEEGSPDQARQNFARRQDLEERGKWPEGDEFAALRARVVASHAKLHEAYNQALHAAMKAAKKDRALEAALVAEWDQWRSVNDVLPWRDVEVPATEPPAATIPAGTAEATSKPDGKPGVDTGSRNLPLTELPPCFRVELAGKATGDTVVVELPFGQRGVTVELPVTKGEFHAFLTIGPSVVGCDLGANRQGMKVLEQATAPRLVGKGGSVTMLRWKPLLLTPFADHEATKLAKEAEDQRANLTKQINKASDELLDLQTKQTKQEQKIENQKQRIAKKQAEIERDEQRRRDTSDQRSDLKTLKSNLADYEKTLDGLEQKVQQARNALDSLRAQLAELGG